MFNRNIKIILEHKILSAVVAVFFTVILLVVYVGFKMYREQRNEIKETRESIFSLNRFVEQLKHELEMYTASSSKSNALNGSALKDIRADIETQKEIGTEKLPTQLIKDIMKRVVFVYCAGPKGAWRGTGTTQLAPYPEPVVITNYHIADVGNAEDTRCEIHLPLPPEYATYGKAFLATVGAHDKNYPIVDAVVLRVQDVSPEEREEYFSAFPVSFCRTGDIAVGNDMTIFGYPKFGINTLTVTTGVVSGFLKTDWGPKYKTSAKMDLGNSGGVAVDNKFRCIMGIPTWTQYGGQIGDILKTGESLGQIQSWEMIVTSGGLFE